MRWKEFLRRCPVKILCQVTTERVRRLARALEAYCELIAEGNGEEQLADITE